MKQKGENMTSREIAEKAFNDADKANSQKRIDELQSLTSEYKVCLREQIFARERMRRFKERLKESEFNLDDIITVHNLQNKDDYNACILQEAAIVGGSKNEDTTE